MKYLWCCLILFAIPQQTAREYYNELKAANSFNRYKDEYICFRDDDVPTIMVVARVRDIIEHLKKIKDPDALKKMSEIKDDIFLTSYYKGVAGEDQVYEPIKNSNKGEDGQEYFVEFGGKFPGKMTYTFNWVTGRYLQKVFMYGKDRDLPTAEGSGKCELIHPASSF